MYRKLTLSIYLILLCSGLISQNVSPLIWSAAPVNLPEVKPEMKTAGFWIAKHPAPDSLIASPTEINAVNDRTSKANTGLVNILGLDRNISGTTIGNTLSSQIRSLVGRSLVDSEGKKPDAAYWQKVRTTIGLGSLPGKIEVRYGVLVRFSSQRVLPTDDPLYEKTGDVEFDQLQNSGYDFGTAHAIYATSTDGNWCFVQSEASLGWFRTIDMAICSYDELKAYLGTRSMVVITEAKADFWLDRELKTYGGFARMGSSFPMVIPPTPYKPDSGTLPPKESYFTVRIPMRTKSGTCAFNEAYIAKTDAFSGYLPYTARNVLTQAFKLQGHSYGWGDANGDWDCSALMKSLFSVFGFKFPRNGGAQEYAGTKLHSFSNANSREDRKKIIIDKAIPALTMLRMPGHIMLYLGEVDSEPYAFHSVWGYGTPGKNEEDIPMVINKAVVTDLDLGSGSKKGSWLARLTYLIFVK